MPYSYNKNIKLKFNTYRNGRIFRKRKIIREQLIFSTLSND